MEEKNKMEIKDFERSLERLDQIVSKLETGEIPLEEAMKLFEEGMKLSEFCGKTLDEAERKVEILVKKAGQGVVEEPFQESEGGIHPDE